MEEKRELLKRQIQNYKPQNEQEQKDKELMLFYINTFDDVLTRENKIGHFTSSAWVVNPKRTKVLMAYHNIYQSWAWTGGHADGEADLLQVAIKEVKEETGVQHVKVLNPNIFSLEILSVDGHIKRGEYISTHVHLNATFLLEVEENETLCIKQDENSAVKWIPNEQILSASTEENMKVVYQKLGDRSQWYQK